MQLQITTHGTEQALRVLRAVADRCRTLAPVLERFGVHMVRSVELNFEAGGRPLRWLPSQRALRTGGKTLVDTAVLKNSIVYEVRPGAVAVGTNVPYARPHQLGFTGAVQVPGHLRRVKTRDVYGREMRRSRKTGRLYEARVRTGSGFAVVSPHERQMRIPARPFLVVQEEDLQILRDLLEAHVAEEQR